MILFVIVWFQGQIRGEKTCRIEFLKDHQQNSRVVVLSNGSFHKRSTHPRKGGKWPLPFPSDILGKLKSLSPLPHPMQISSIGVYGFFFWNDPIYDALSLWFNPRLLLLADVDICIILVCSIQYTHSLIMSQLSSWSGSLAFMNREPIAFHLDAWQWVSEAKKRIVM